MDIIECTKDIEKDIINWRRELHKIPGIDFDLDDTNRFIKNRLDEMGISYKTIAKCGIVAVIPSGKPGKTLALRADMDGLRLKEETGLPYASSNGCMHACGHDAHIAMLLGAAKILSMSKDKFHGNIKLIFQPAEENKGGALPMIKEDCLENPKVDAIAGMHIGHLFEEVENGMVGVRCGATMASVDKFIVKIIGKGGHGASPERCIDPITTASEMVTSLQKILSREINPMHSAVITIGKIQGGTAFNIIPEEVIFEGTVRTLDSNDRDFIQKRLTEMCKDIALSNRADVDINYIRRYPVLVNDDKVTEKFVRSAKKIVGSDKIIYLKEPIMVSEDMAYYLENVPGTFFYLGSNNIKKGIIYPHHHPKFDVDEDVLYLGTALFVQFAFDFLLE